ncbi:MAG: hypothetical protein J6S85_21095 [Methanobrevibacter sp.]|mgnify:CR=1 FL=1|nr:hypothetical protein [Methanobrevibacter sp.]
MARRYRKSRRVSQRQYRARLAKYERYKANSLDPVSFKEWNAPYRQSQFLKKEYKIYLEKFTKRKSSARYGFRLTEEGEETQAYSYRDFKEQYLLTRNTLKEEVEMGERERVGSVVTEMINDQAYELSSAKARAVANYLLREERPMLIEKGYLRVETNEAGEQIDIIKKRNLALLIRQGQFVEEEVGLWDEIKDYYKVLTNQGFTAQEAKSQIGQTYFNSK